MKRFKTVILFVVMIFALSGCGSEDDGNDIRSPEDTSVTAAASDNAENAPGPLSDGTDSAENASDSSSESTDSTGDASDSSSESTDSTEGTGTASQIISLESLTDVENEIAGLKNVEGSIYINEAPEYEQMVKTLLYQAQDTTLKGSVIAATDDAVIFASGTRLLDTEGNEVTPYTTYEIGSMTKSITAVCTMKLVEAGLLSLEDTLAELYPEYDYCSNFEKVGSISVYELLHMRSGVYDYLNESDKFFTPELVSEICDENYASLSSGDRLEYFFSNVGEKEILECLFTDELKSEPGTEYAYCNTNYYLLSLIIEKKTGKPYEQNIQEMIFEPCKMSSSSSMTEGDVTASMTSDAWHFLPGYTKGAGDIHSNVVDMLKYHRALFSGCLLGEDSMKELLTVVDGYACGWAVDGEVYSHGGDTSGFCTRNYVIEKNGKRLYVMMFSNPRDNRGDALLDYLGKLFE